MRETPEKAVMPPKIMKQSEEKKLSTGGSATKGYSSFLGNWNKVNHKNTSAQQDIRKSFEKLNLNN
jgi:hypothetical protein